ncbi:basic leucine zipper 6 [Canna indica]|uniref:Basic leucine zipper 6 n=1 Tax=Canna indica TaxID=4628 RepID=A0AAQ3QIR8_9LILI|nr:basic leucine zipper 6 [Canna indica]
MSWPAPLPPRSPFHSRGLPRRALDSAPYSPQNDNHRFPSNSHVLDEQPLWLDDLLTDHEIRPRGISLRRSSSDPVALLEVATSIHGPISPVYQEDALSDCLVYEPTEADADTQIGNRFESGSCIYGPNSPRQKSKLADSESSMMAAFLENVPSNQLQYLSNYPSTCVINQSQEKEDDYTPSAISESEKISRMCAGQRSRIRKHQHISELERTVDMLQTLGADLAAKVASLFQYRLALSVENKKLRQQIASLQQEKTIMDGQHQSLKKEAEKLRMISGRHRRSKSAAPCVELAPTAVDPSSVNWQALEFGKLNLGGS